MKIFEKSRVNNSCAALRSVTVGLLGLGTLMTLPLACGPDGEPPVDPAPTCGGFVGVPCPGAGECVDDPSDDCDPQNGGADCTGLCECNVEGLCIEGERWDSSPNVCGCVADYDPCIAALCPTGTRCVNQEGQAQCIPLEPEPCGDTTCDAGMVCCNASCGICTPPDGVCIQIACL